MNNTKEKTRNITICAVMVALATVLSLIKFFDAPYGGSVTLGSMVPLVILSVKIRDFRWGMLACFAYSLIQMLLGFAPPPTATFLYFAAVVLLDYVIAFTVISVANPISKLFKNKTVGVGVGSAVAVFLRFLCHFASGILIWGVYAEDMPVWLYSLTYNGGYMLFEFIITVVVSTLISPFVLKNN